MQKMNRRKSDVDPINKWWNWIRPWWHIASFFIVIIFIASTKLANIQAYGDVLILHEKRLSALEVWQAGASNDIATMRQEVRDIHEWVRPKNKE